MPEIPMQQKRLSRMSILSERLSSLQRELSDMLTETLGEEEHKPALDLFSSEKLMPPPPPPPSEKPPVKGKRPSAKKLSQAKLLLSWFTRFSFVMYTQVKNGRALPAAK
ncbi:uncharacterized protein VTP21DRAFT_2986 [Calcarisporiella thermophila]|uniref:uncharacterized protein n=1 Tax=Calcarisporiella thermophila TaxID=911321 RepID=UPI0037439D6E